MSDRPTTIVERCVAADQVLALDEVRAAVLDGVLGALCRHADVLKRVLGKFHASDVAACAADAARAYLEKLR